MHGGLLKDLIFRSHIRVEPIRTPSHHRSFEIRAIARCGSPCSLWAAFSRSAVRRTDSTAALLRRDGEKAGGQSSPTRGHLMTCNHGLNALNVGARRNNS